MPVPQDSKGRILWPKVEGFVLFVKDPKVLAMTNTELAKTIKQRWDVSLSPGAIASVRRRWFSPMDAQTRRRAYEQRDVTYKEAAEAVPTFVRELGPKDERYFVSVTGDCIVSSDWHIPHHKESLVDRLCQIAQAWRIPTLVINGDFLNQDAFSKWKGHRFNVPWAEEKNVARDLLKRLFSVFKELVYILDNHDRRIIAANEHPSEFTESDVIELLTWGVQHRKLRPSMDYHYVVVNGKWRVTSPKEYRRNKLTLPNRLAQLYHQDVIVGGDHLFGLGMDDSNHYVIANSMCLVDPARTPYISVQDTTYPHWNPGFYMIRNNHLRAYPDNPSLTDWDEEIRIGQLLQKRRA